MVEQVEQRLGEVPAQWLVDGGFPAHEQIDAVADALGAEFDGAADQLEPR